eukprot:TRINITY_DN1031_c1_g1_i3.p1 TRINITY_DN1031_c1_g1~~TRINITY_DN1031_c1_g1_i3.p1  ORF type:complete len:561 (+),score=119.07 TRINITY_DN1031_c1_g1_i3:198-1880(+)
MDLKIIALDSLKHGVRSVKPDTLIKNTVNLENGILNVKNKNEIYSFSSDSFENVLILGGGKASGNMCTALVEILEKPNRFNISGTVSVPHGQNFPQILPSSSPKVSVTINFAGHPTPDEAGVNGTKKMMEHIQSIKPKTLVFVLVSGGGSALLPSPEEGLSLEDVQITNDLLLKSGANIIEINSVRKQLDSIKGGKLARKIIQHGDKVVALISLILSDVIGDDLRSIASGPTILNDDEDDNINEGLAPSSLNAINICKKYHLWVDPRDDKEKAQQQQQQLLPKNVVSHLSKKWQNGNSTKSETTTSSHKIYNILVGSASTSSNAVKSYLLEGLQSSSTTTTYSSLLSKSGFDVVDIFSESISGEASIYGRSILPKTIRSLLLKELSNATNTKNCIVNDNNNTPNHPKRIAFIGTGELTVTINKSQMTSSVSTQTGIGGRNQEMLLSFLIGMYENELSQAGKPFLEDCCCYDKYHYDWVIYGAAYDGIEGNSPAMGAIVHSKSLELVKNAGITLDDMKNYLERNDSYNFFKRIDSTIEFGQTGTNVNDMIVVLIHRETITL